MYVNIIMTSLRLSKELEMRLNILSSKTQRSKSFYIKAALEKYLTDLEDTYIALDRIMEPNRKFYSSEAVLDIIEKN